MKRLVLLFFILHCLTPCVYADQLSPEEALTRMSKDRKMTAGLQKNRMRLAYTASRKEKNLFYVFKDETRRQSLILGADDLLPAVIAYDLNEFDIENMPPQLSDWLTFYQDVCSQVILENRPISTGMATGSAVKPLVQTKWDQMEPYNKYCAQYMHINVPTGCVATAMAQIMNYWQYPEKGTGVHSYTTSTGVRLTADFGNTTYDWGNMRNFYGNYAIEGESSQGNASYTDGEADAVALLMYHCGVAVDMKYTENSSGATTSNAGTALITYFGYDKGMRYHNREVYSDEEWQQMLLDELYQGRPVIYSGRTIRNEGHAFVCDGYDGNGYFHFNWGWSGMADGYYMVTGADPLHPQYHGTGGSLNSDAYNQGQYVISRIQPAQPGSKADVSMMAQQLIDCAQGKCCAVLYTEGNEELTGNAMRGVPYWIQGIFYSNSVIPLNADLGAILRNVNTGAEYPCYGITASSLPAMAGYSSYTLYLDYVPENGTFEVYPAYLPLDETGAPVGEWRRMLMPPNAVPFKVTLKGTLPLMRITDVQLSKENGYYTTKPELSVTIKALSSFSKKKLSGTIYEWDGSNASGTYSIASSLSMKTGEEVTLTGIPFRVLSPLNDNQAYKLQISCSGYNYKLGDLCNTNFHFYVGHQESDAIVDVPADAGISPQHEEYYDLQGRRVYKPLRGLYIRNGKKILVK